MAINYERVIWDTTKYVNPSNMNQMDEGIKDACDGVDRLDGDMTQAQADLIQAKADITENAEEISVINSNLESLIPFLKNETLMPYGETARTFDCNNIETAVMAVGGNSENMPVSGQYFIIVSFKLGDSLAIQYAMSFNDNKAYMRIKWSNWRQWEQITNK